MKLTIYTFLILSVLLGSQSVAQTIDQTLVNGHWQVDFDKTVHLMPEACKGQYDSLTTEAQTKMRGDLSGQRFVFHPDHTFEAITGDGTSYPGQWSVDMNNKSLIMHYDQGTELTNPIEVLTDDTLVLKIASDNSEALFHFLHLDLISR